LDWFTLGKTKRLTGPETGGTEAEVEIGRKKEGHGENCAPPGSRTTAVQMIHWVPCPREQRVVLSAREGEKSSNSRWGVKNKGKKRGLKV